MKYEAEQVERLLPLAWGLKPWNATEPPAADMPTAKQCDPRRATDHWAVRLDMILAWTCSNLTDEESNCCYLVNVEGWSSVAVADSTGLSFQQVLRRCESAIQKLTDYLNGVGK